jgi:hypothetical protein
MRQGSPNAIMKIKSINFKESDRYYVTFNTEPILQQSVFNHFMALAADEPEFKNCLPELSGTSALKIFFGEAVGSTFPADFPQKVERILTVAESLVQNEVDAKKDQADREHQEKKAALEAVAKKWGIPIE